MYNKSEVFWMNSWKKMVRAVCAATLVTAAFAGCGNSGGSKSSGGDTIKVGALFELTGNVANYGTSTLNGFKMAVDEINAKGGVNGKKIEIVQADNKSEPSESGNAATKLVTRDKVVAVVGPATSGSVAAAEPILTANKIPLIAPCATAPEITVGKDGKVWFTGANVKGYVESMEGDSVQLHFVESDAGKTTVPTERMRREQGEVDRWKEVEVYQRLPISNTRTLLATATEGVIAIDADGQEVWRISTENGLCSNSVTKLAYDGKGSVWGATDNGVFRIFTSEIYTHFGENEGLRGQISCIAKSNNVLMVGTFQGLFRLQGQRFHQVEGVAHACWQLEPNGSGGLLAAT